MGSRADRHAGIGPDGFITFERRKSAAPPGQHRTRENGTRRIASSPPWTSARLNSWGSPSGSFVAQQVALTRPAIVRRLIIESAAQQGRRRQARLATEVSAPSAPPKPAPRNTSASSFTRPRQSGGQASKPCSALRPDRGPGPRRKPGRLVKRSMTRSATWGIRPRAAPAASAPEMPVFVANGDSDR